MGFKRLAVVVVGVLLAVAGVAIAGYFASTSLGLRPYNLQATLPEMMAKFGANARVVEIIVSSNDVYFQVIGPDRRLHIRDYAVVESEIEAGTYGYNRKIRNYVRAPTAAESHGAVLQLGQIDPTVVDRLYGKVGFPRQGSSATLTGRSWFLQSGVRPDDSYLAAYNGSEVHLAKSATAPDPNSASASATVPATPPTRRSRTGTTSTYSFTTTISSGPANPRKLHRTERLLACIEHAQGDVNKIATCQQRFVP